jgi:hypothetical protein
MPPPRFARLPEIVLLVIVRPRLCLALPTLDIPPPRLVAVLPEMVLFSIVTVQ